MEATPKGENVSSYESELRDLDAREAFALAQGREDLLDVIDAERRDLQQRRDEEESAESEESGL